MFRVRSPADRTARTYDSNGASIIIPVKHLDARVRVRCTLHQAYSAGPETARNVRRVRQSLEVALCTICEMNDMRRTPGNMFCVFHFFFVCVCDFENV